MLKGKVFWVGKSYLATLVNNLELFELLIGMT